MFPMEIITMFGATLLSGVMTLWAQNLKAKAQYNETLLKLNTARNRAIKEAREAGLKDKGFSFTKRTIALTIIGSIIALPKIVAAFFPEIPVTVGWTELQGGFWFFTEDKEAVVWKTVQGLTLTPLDTHAVMAVLGMYFGHSVVGKVK